jgi:rsbT co-antagonist protein RsbR
MLAALADLQIKLGDKTGAEATFRRLDAEASKQAEQERLSLERSIAQQAQHLLELSTPLIPVSEDVLVMPLIGSLDPARAEYSLETLLQGVKTMSARYVLVDLTGISTVDASGAVALGRMVKAVRLLGAQVLLTGMRAEIAKAIHACGEELAGMKVHPSLRSAIAEYVTNRRLESRSQSRGLRALL